MKKLLMRAGLAAGTLGLVLAGAAAFSAFEAHVVNVTATINNATDITTSQILFGNVFPQEILHNPVTLSLSTSFLSAGNTRANSVNYVIKQKPKCMGMVGTATAGLFAQVVDVSGTTGPVTFACPTGYVVMPLLCPYLSKTSPTAGDTSVLPFHGPTDLTSWTDSVSSSTEAVGHLSVAGAHSTTWDIDLHTPCFKGQCAQDWDSFVTGANSAVTTTSQPYNTTYYQASSTLAGMPMGCDLWYELTGVNSASVSSEVVYNAVPATLAPNYPSQAFQAQQTSEFGDYVHLGGTDRQLTKVTVTMDNWALAASPENVTFCTTHPASCPAGGFIWPITVNIYNVVPGSPTNTVGSLLGTITQNITIPWRPVGDPTCPNTGYGLGFAYKVGSTCYNGIASNAIFDLSSLNVTLPNDVIVGFVYNTQSYGPAPVGVDGPYNSLNIAVPSSDPVTVGSDVSVDKVFWNTSTASYYTNKACLGGTFCEDTNWTPYGTVALKIEAQ
jgi:hypothetical protein